MNCVIKIKYIEEKKIIFIYENIYIKKKKNGTVQVVQPPRRWSRQHEPTSHG